MADTVNITIRIDRNLKEEAELLFNGLGMNLSTAINIFARQSLRQGKIPFEIADPFYSERNQSRLAQSIEHAEAGILNAHELCEG